MNFARAAGLPHTVRRSSRLLGQRFAWAFKGRSIWALCGEAVRRTWHLTYFLLQRRLLRNRFFEKRVGTFQMLLDANDPGMARQLIRIGDREVEQRFILERELKAGMTALDLSANIGYYSLAMANRVGHDGRVYAVEPFARSFALLSLNVLRNRLTGIVHVEQLAIGSEDGERSLPIVEHGSRSGAHPASAYACVSRHSRDQRSIVGSVVVPTRSLRSYLADKPPVDLLRMDLEGHEVEILQCIAGLPTAQQRRLHVLMETHPQFYHPRSNDMRGILDTLCREHGFHIKYLVSAFHFGARSDPGIIPGNRVFARYGYGAEHIVRQFRNRAVYANFQLQDAIDLICSSEYVHAAFLAPTPTDYAASTDHAPATDQTSV